jgi:hypothetical protein
MVFFTKPTGGSDTERVRISGDGNVGIGLTNPLTKLHVYQNWVNNVGSIGVEGSSNALVGYGFRSNGTYKAALIYRDGTAGNYLDLGTYNGNYPILFRPNATEEVRIDSDGLKFNGDTAAANALNDYEEGTFTPTLPNGTSLTNSGAYYVKIGRFVNFYCYITALNIPNNSSQFRVGGLPFTVLSGMYGGPSSISYAGSANDSRIANLAPNTQTNDTYIYFHTVGIGEAFILTNAHFQVMNSRNLNIQGCYMTAS